MEIFKLLGTVAINTSDAENSLNSVTGQASSAQGKMSAAFGKIATAVTAAFSVKAIVDFGKACFDAAASAEASFAKVKTLLAEGTDTEAYYKSIQQAAADTGVSVEEYSEAVYGAISASVDQADAVEFTRQAIMLAKGGFTDAGTAVDILTTCMNSYGESAGSAEEIANRLITTQNLGKTTVAELGSAMGKVIPTAKQFGVDLDTLCGSYAVMTKNGVATAESTTYINSMLNELGKAGTKSSKLLLEKTGKSFSELMAEGYSLTDVLKIIQDAADESGLSMADMFGSAEAGKAAAILADNADDLDASIQAMGESAGATQQAYETMASTMQEKLQKLKNKFDILKATLGAKLAPAVGWVVDKLSVMADFLMANLEPAIAWITEKFQIAGSYLSETFAPVIENVKTIFTNLKTAFQPIIDKLSQFVSSGEAAAGASNILKNAVEFVSGALETVTGWIVKGISWLDQYVLSNEDVKTTISTVWKSIKGYFSSAWTEIKAVWDAVSPYFDTIWESIKTTFSVVKDVVGVYFSEAWDYIKTVWDAATTFFETLWTNIKALFNGEETPKDFWGNLFKAAWDYIVEIWNAAVDYFTGVWNGIKAIFGGEEGTAGSDWLSGVFDTAWKAITAVWDLAIGFFQAVWDGICAVFGVDEETKSGIETIFESAWTYITGIWDVAVGYFTDLWTNIMAVFNGEETVEDFFRNLFQNSWDAITGIWDTVTTYFQGIWDGICKIFGVDEESKNAIEKVFSDTWDNIKAIWDGVSTWFDTYVITPIKGLFDFTFEWPSIPMPHFGIQPEGWEIGDLLKGSIPSLGIDWYAKGGVMESPTVFGVNGNRAMVGGEAGAEAIAPIDTLKQYITEAVAQQQSGVEKLLETIADKLENLDININNVTELDGKVIGESAYKYSKRKERAVGV